MTMLKECQNNIFIGFDVITFRMKRCIDVITFQSRKQCDPVIPVPPYMYVNNVSPTSFFVMAVQSYDILHYFLQ